jgi:hypothetical protein
MNRGYLALGAAVVLLVVALYLAVRTHSSDATASAGDTAPAGSQAERAHARVAPAPAPSALDDAVHSDPADPGKSSTDYMVGGVRVRDHRTGVHVRSEVPPVIHAPGGRKLPTELVAGIAQRARAAVASCAASLTGDARGAKPRLEGEIAIAIADHQATITSAVLQPRDIVDAAQDSLAQCAQRAVVGLATPSGDEPDIAGYAITMSLRLP